eukprot:PhF_6_TR43086/c1_g1_i3/m.65793
MSKSNNSKKGQPPHPPPPAPTPTPAQQQPDNSSPLPSPAINVDTKASPRPSVNPSIEGLYRYVHHPSLSKDERKRIKSDWTTSFGEAEAKALFTLLDTQRKEIDQKPHMRPPIPAKPDAKYIETVSYWWNTIQIPLDADGGAEGGVVVGGSSTVTLLGPFPEPILVSSGATGPGVAGVNEGPPTNVLDEFYHKLAHVSADTLSKVLESVTQKDPRSQVPQPSRKEMQDALMERMVRAGAEKFAHLVERGGALDVFETNKQGLVDMLCSRLVQTINSVPVASAPRVVKAMCLPTTCDMYDVVERVLVLGLQDVLRNVKTRVLKKITQEVTAIAHTSGSDNPTGNAIHDIIVQVFPQEQKRTSDRISTTVPSISRTALEFLASKCEGNHGVTLWRLLGVSLLRTSADRCISPEFTFGGHKWSLLCMQNNGNLAVYLRQVSRVRCVFFVYILNRRNEPELQREGTTIFSGAPNDTDWGFAEVIPFSALMDTGKNIWNERNDMITFQVKIGVLGDNSPSVPKPVAPSVQNPTATNNNSPTSAEDAKKKEPKEKQQKEIQKVTKASMTQLKTTESRIRKEIETECFAKYASWRTESTQELSRLEKIRKTKEHRMQTLIQQRDQLMQKKEDIETSIKEETSGIAALRKDIQASIQTKKKADEEVSRAKAEFEELTAQYEQLKQKKASLIQQQQQQQAAPRKVQPAPVAPIHHTQSPPSAAPVHSVTPQNTNHYHQQHQHQHHHAPPPPMYSVSVPATGGGGVAAQYIHHHHVHHQQHYHQPAPHPAAAPTQQQAPMMTNQQHPHHHQQHHSESGGPVWRPW